MEERGIKKTKRGVVVSDKTDKTVIVAVMSQVKHAKYGKFVRRTSKYMAHDEKNVAKLGDQVEIMESRPLSARKRWRVVSIVAQGDGVV